MIGQFAILILSIDALLRMLLDNDQTKEFIPEKLRKQNKYGAFSNGIWLVVILSGAIILIQTVMPGAASVLQQLTRLNSVCMPLRYLWVFVAYIALRKAIRTIDAEYRFVKIRKLPTFLADGASLLPLLAVSWECTIKIHLPWRSTLLQRLC